MNYISYETMNKLSQFLGEDAPTPSHIADKTNISGHGPWQSYTLEDILCPAFCNPITAKTIHGGKVKEMLFSAWYHGDFEELESEILHLISKDK